MLIFTDESGDLGFKFGIGSSTYFTMVAVIFETEENAESCRIKIEELRRKLQWHPKSEFHFNNNSFRVREEFLRTIANQKFRYYITIIDKTELQLFYRNKKNLYKLACELTFGKIGTGIAQSNITIDQLRNTDLEKELKKVIKSIARNQTKKSTMRVNFQTSYCNNLLQLADYIASVEHKALTDYRSRKLLELIKVKRSS